MNEFIYPKREIGISHYPMPHSLFNNDSSMVIEHLNKSSSSKGILLYVHIPFCIQICNFCPYNKRMINDYEIEVYLSSLFFEIESYKNTQHICNNDVKAIYIGGGTPSVLSLEQIKLLFSKISSSFKISDDAEITMEGNAHSFNLDKLRLLKSLGVNRISLGVQSFNQKYCDLLEVSHSTNETKEIISIAQNLGFKVSVVLMFNLPGQTLDEFKYDLYECIKMNIKHITLYPLILIPHTKLYHLYFKNEESNKRLKKELRMFISATNILQEYNYKQDTTYDFYKEDNIHIYARKHFVERIELLGVGTGSFGELCNTTYINTGNFSEYLKLTQSKQLPILLRDKISVKERIEAILIMGLRHLEVDIKRFEEFNVDPFKQFNNQLQRLSQSNLLEFSGNKIRLTSRGKIWGNNICKEFYSEEYKKKLPAWERMETLSNHLK